ncbi:hypothetical protein EYF80_006951 [Liparis tanakae]|uniref:Uncharacterized protein n=1 Tax=Liparis tanakae TaxID=230148 RepID=A0A4Z2IXL1_9TELE|nr:hypothetical protein EYF80_006951 [Liparis tanakae]
MAVRKPGTEVAPTRSLHWHTVTLRTLAAMSWKSFPVQLTRSPRRKMGQYRPLRGSGDGRRLRSDTKKAPQPAIPPARWTREGRRLPVDMQTRYDE